jgi:hypothetical protein
MGSVIYGTYLGLDCGTFVFETLPTPHAHHVASSKCVFNLGQMGAMSRLSLHSPNGSALRHVEAYQFSTQRWVGGKVVARFYHEINAHNHPRGFSRRVAFKRVTPMEHPDNVRQVSLPCTALYNVRNFVDRRQSLAAVALHGITHRSRTNDASKVPDVALKLSMRQTSALNFFFVYISWSRCSTLA